VSVPEVARVEAAARGEGVVAHLQPLVDLTRGCVAGHEALVRFDGGPGPLAWFHVARGAGLAAQLEAAALRAALAHRGTLPVNTFLTVNVSPDLLDHPLVRAELLAGSLRGVVVELTEDTRIESYAAIAAPLQELREAGAMVAVDDAGAGYAGLAHLLHLRPDFVKLDRDIVAGLDRDEAKRAMVDMMGTLAARLDAWVVAEGVETRAELAVLCDLGVPLAQGWCLGRPGPGFGELDPEVALAVRERVAGSGAASLQALLEPAATAPTREQAEWCGVLASGEPVVVTGLGGHPVGILAADGTWCSVHAGALRLNVATPVADAAVRALTRPAAQRFHPLLCTDDAGRLAGIVRMERVVDALARDAG